MPENVVFTLTGPDRIGIVDEVTTMLLDLEANIETSRMVRLGGEFAMLMLISIPESRRSDLDAVLAQLASKEYRVSTTPTHSEPRATANARSYRVEVTGADHEGIIRDIAHGLAQQGINIESANTTTVEAPMSGTPLFRMDAIVEIPAGMTDSSWMDDLNNAGARANVDVEISAVD